ncbi:Uu.00g106290.m01.CDS01 [Anthostomella pinea]|uniref:Uu.00g106290.m01.CDS01 n=1 Tax=Anthostomella pinea TaxID=933095 RepID=A0AAI8VE69_9PEZI|nr:Uu.00g106290.m01.CDS01 [Anthostomella pinea]
MIINKIAPTLVVDCSVVIRPLSKNPFTYLAQAKPASGDANRLHIQKDMAKGFTGKLVQKVNALDMGNGLGPAAEAPFGFVKESVYGKEGSLYGLAEYQSIKSITIDNLDS